MITTFGLLLILHRITWGQMQPLFVLGVDVVGDIGYTFARVYLLCDKQTILAMEIKHLIAMEQYMI